MASFTIILPCYNPPTGWVDMVKQSFADIKQHNPAHSFLLIMVNDGSRKGFDPEALKVLGAYYLINLPDNHGKGFALRAGVADEPDTDYYIYTDVDFPYTAASMQRVINELLTGQVNIAAGVRDARYYEGIPLVRKLVSRFLRGLIKTLLRLQITDTQCGLKGFDKKGRQLFLQTTINRYLFDLEFIFLASREPSVRLKAVEVELRENIVFSRLNTRILLGELRNLLKIIRLSLVNNKKRT